MKKKLKPQKVLDPKRQVTLQFYSVAERDMWMRWYYCSGNRHFSCHMMQYGSNWWKTKTGLKWRKAAEDRLKYWPDRNERFVG